MKLTKTNMKNKKYKALRVLKGASIEDIPAIREDFEKQAIVAGASMLETEAGFEFDTGQFFLKPKNKKETIGILNCGASYAKFNDVRIEYTDINITDPICLNFETEYANYSIQGIL